MNNLSSVKTIKASQVLAQTKTKQEAIAYAIDHQAPAAAIKVRRGLWLAVRLQKSEPIPCMAYAL